MSIEIFDKLFDESYELEYCNIINLVFLTDSKSFAFSTEAFDSATTRS